MIKYAAVNKRWPPWWLRTCRHKEAAGSLGPKVANNKHGPAGTLRPDVRERHLPAALPTNAVTQSITSDSRGTFFQIISCHFITTALRETEQHLKSLNFFLSVFIILVN